MASHVARIFFIFLFLMFKQNCSTVSLDGIYYSESVAYIEHSQLQVLTESKVTRGNGGGL